MKNYEINILYGVLTDGDNTIRKTTADRQSLSDTGKKIVSALIPTETSKTGTRALTELYIRLCYSDPAISRMIQTKDPLNTYPIWSCYEAFNDSVDIEKIVDNIRKIGLADEENSFLPVDYILNAMRKLVESLNG